MNSTTRILILVLCFGVTGGVARGQALGDFMTHQAGNWSSASTWERFDGINWIHPAPHTPTSADGKITILSGHTVTVTADVSVDQVNAFGAIKVAGSQTLTIVDGVDTDFTLYDTVEVNGRLINNGTSLIWVGGTVQVVGTLTNNATLQIFHGTVQLAGTLTNNGTTEVDNVFQIEQGGSVTGNNLVYGLNGTLIFNNSGPYEVNSGSIIWPSTSGPAKVVVQGPGGIRMNVARAVRELITAASVVNANNLTISGTVEINAGGFFDVSPVYSGEARLFYNTGGSYNVSTEWISGTTVGAGVPMHIIIGGGTTVNMPSSARTCPGDFTIDGTLVLSTTAGIDLSIRGDWRCTGALIANSRAVLFNGAEEQAIRGVTTFDNLIINNVAGISVPGYKDSETEEIDSVTVSQALTFTAGNVRLGEDFEAYLILAGSVSGVTIARHVVTYSEGLVVRSIAGGGSFQFPIGPTETSYNPLTIALDPADPTETFSVRVDSTVDIGAPDDSLFVQRTWHIQEALPGDNHAALTFQWAGAEEGAKFTRNASSTYLNDLEIVRNGIASGTDPYIVSTTGGFPCTEFFQYTVGTSRELNAVEGRENESPISFMLSQNYPNPFLNGAKSRSAGNPSTTIRYTIPSPGYVMLKMYDLVGKEIATLVSEKQTAGEHEVRWYPAGLPSGVYFYRLQAGDTAPGSAKKLVAIRKLILLQ